MVYNQVVNNQHVTKLHFQLKIDFTFKIDSRQKIIILHRPLAKVA